MAAATDLLRHHRLDEAAKCLENLQVEFPENQEVAHLLAYAQKEQAALARTEAVESARPPKCARGRNPGTSRARWPRWTGH